MFEMEEEHKQTQSNRASGWLSRLWDWNYHCHCMENMETEGYWDHRGQRE